MDVTDQPELRGMDAIVLAGGQSDRMGVPKANLPFGDSTLIETVISTLRPLFKTVYVVGRERDRLAGLDATLLIDDRDGNGPLVGLARGLSASDAQWCFAVGCDMPFLSPRVIGRMAGLLDDCDVLAASVEGHVQPLHAFYSTACLPAAQRLLDEGDTSLRGLLNASRVRSVEARGLLDVDPKLDSFRDLDTAEEYNAALRIAGHAGAPIPAPEQGPASG